METFVQSEIGKAARNSRENTTNIKMSVGINIFRRSVATLAKTIEKYPKDVIFASSINRKMSVHFETATGENFQFLFKFFHMCVHDGNNLAKTLTGVFRGFFLNAWSKVIVPVCFKLMVS